MTRLVDAFRNIPHHDSWLLTGFKCFIHIVHKIIKSQNELLYTFIVATTHFYFVTYYFLSLSNSLHLLNHIVATLHFNSSVEKEANRMLTFWEKNEYEYMNGWIRTMVSNLAYLFLFILCFFSRFSIMNVGWYWFIPSINERKSIKNAWLGMKKGFIEIRDVALNRK